MSRPLVDKRTAADISKALVGSEGKGPLYLYTTGYSAWAAWGEFDKATLQPTGASAALIGLFSRWVELIIERLNQVPDKNFIAFLNTLGAAQLPPEPARVPITFALAAGRTAEATVPQGTQVAAPADAAVPQPSTFELERSLVVVPLILDSLVTLDPVQDTYASRSNASGASAFPAFAGDQRLEHILYIGDEELLGYPSISGLRLNVNLTEDLTDADPRQVAWERADETGWSPLDVTSDGTGNLTKKAENTEPAKTIVFTVPSPRNPAGLSHVQAIGTHTSRWLRCRLKTPMTSGEPGAADMVSASQLPTINGLAGSRKGLELEVDLSRAGSAMIAPDVGFANSAPLDLGKEFYPFGEKPKTYDTFYFASRDAFSKDQTDLDATKRAAIDIVVDLAASPVGPSTDPPLLLAWDYWNGKAWTTFDSISDDTYQLTRTGTVTLSLPQVAGLTSINGEENFFFRVRIIQGNYGEEAKLVEDASKPSGFAYQPATFKPPVISKLSIGYELSKKRAPDLCVTNNDLALLDVPQPGAFQPFTPPKGQQQAALYLAFSLPSGASRFPNTTISLYASVAAAVFGETTIPLSPLVSLAIGMRQTPDSPSLTAIHRFTVTNGTNEDQSYSLEIRGQRETGWSIEDLPGSFDMGAGETRSFEVTIHIPLGTTPGTLDRGFLQLSVGREHPTLFTATLVTAVEHMPLGQAPGVRWEYWNGHAWALLSLQRDESEGLTKPGLLQFTGPPDFAARRLFEQDRYWIRANFDPGDGSSVPRLHRFHLNTMSAIQSATILNETLGSSGGDEDQTFRTTRAPVLAGQRLEVREIDLPAASEREVLDAEEGSDAVTVTNGSTGASAVWVRWHEVPDFYGSGPRDRHYVLDHLKGEVRFGDGKAGWIPPLGTNNVRMASYRTGGGASGNRAAGTVTQLKTTVPYVEKPTNPEPADGGAEAETVEAVRERVPRSLRHRDRAVTSEDYEDMARLASLEVAHTRCIPLRDLQTDPLGAVPRPGMASLIVVPRSTETKPLPSLELLSRVESFVEQRSPAGASLVVVGPHYIRIDVTVEVAISADAVVPVVKATIEERLAAFLHPLTGGLDGTGWDFGRQAHKSDLYPLIEGVPGVDHTRYLQVGEIEELAGIRQSGCFLIYSGRHQVSVFFEEA